MQINVSSTVIGGIISLTMTVLGIFLKQVLAYLKSMNTGITQIKEMAIKHNERLEHHGTRLDGHEKRIDKIEDHVFK